MSMCFLSYWGCEFTTFQGKCRHIANATACPGRNWPNSWNSSVENKRLSETSGTLNRAPSSDVNKSRQPPHLSDSYTANDIEKMPKSPATARQPLPALTKAAPPGLNLKRREHEQRQCMAVYKGQTVILKLQLWEAICWARRCNFFWHVQKLP